MRSKKVAVVGHFYADSFAENIHLALQEMGIVSAPVDTRVAASRRPASSTMLPKIIKYGEEMLTRSARLRALADRTIEQSLEEAEPDLVISTNGYLFPDQLERWRVRTPNARWALWYPDHLANLGAQRCFEAPWDRLFFKDAYLVDHLTSYTAIPAGYLPEASLPSRHRTYEAPTEEERRKYGCDATLVGNNYPYQGRVLEALPPIKLKLYGNPPSRWSSPAVRSAFTGEYVIGRPKFLAFTQAKIVVNSLHYAEIQSANTRLFEATACGAFVLTRSTLGVLELYQDGDEVVTFDSAHRLREAVLHYLNADEERARIASAGQRRAHQEHTYEIRLRALISSTLDG